MEDKERKKYEKVWARSEYRKATSPALLALKCIPIFDWLKQYKVKSVLDAGCGSGKFLSRLKYVRPDLDLQGIDIAANAPDKDILEYFTRGALWDPSLYKEVDAIFCVDVLEHIPEEFIDWVLSNFSQFARKFVYLNICLLKDNFGSYLINEPLHLTIKSHCWWFNKFDKHGFKILFCLADNGLLQVLLEPK